jgi:hypothetical protein
LLPSFSIENLSGAHFLDRLLALPENRLGCQGLPEIKAGLIIVSVGDEEKKFDNIDTRSLSDISLSPDISVVIVENKELRCETRVLIENAKYFQVPSL